MIIKKAVFRSLIVAIILLPPSFINAQVIAPEDEGVYEINNKVEIPLTMALFLSNYIGFKYLDKREGLTEDEINALDVNNIPGIDRIATEQDASVRGKYHDASDWVMNITIALPALLAIDRDIRQAWFKLGVMYLE